MRTAIYIFLLAMYWNSNVQSQSVGIVDAKTLFNRVEQGNDTMYVVNFWATWCAPCVEELPIFTSKELQKIHQPLQIILVSLDFNGQIDTQLKPFLKRKGIEETVLWLNEKNPNTWVNLVDTSWTGAIPATKIYYGDKAVFREGEIDAQILKQMIQSVL